MEMYHFVTNWFFQAPIKGVWEELMDLKSWPTPRNPDWDDQV